MDTYGGLDTVNNNWNAISFTKAYNERVSYDGNGNILKYNRYFDNQTTIMDSLTYHYTANTNKLSSVTDQSQGLVNGARKIKNQSTDNYEYDEIGNLIKDNSENIPSEGIKWNVYGKISEINHSQAGVQTNTKKINYYYDAAGNRIGKKLTKFGTANVNYTWYVRDAQGNVMHVYTASVDTTAADDTDAEKLARLSSANLLLSESHLYGSSRLGILNKQDNAEPSGPAGNLYQYKRGQKFYEISNHLGNVLAVISDRKIGHSSNGTTLDYYNPDVVNVTDYYPFGMPMRGGSLGLGLPGATQSGSDTVNGYTVPIDMTLTGNRTSAQPVEYVASNSVEFTGEFESASNDEFSAYIADASYAGTGNQNGGGGGGSFASNPYRYGFNGKENDGDVKGDGNQIDYGMRIYDPRLGRFLSADPLIKGFPQLTPYQYASNKPINSIDVEGAEAAEIIHWVAVVGTSRGAAKLAAPTLAKTFKITEKQSFYIFGFANGYTSAFDIKGLVQATENYSVEAIKEIFTLRTSTFMQDGGMSYERFKKMLPIVKMAEDAYNHLKEEIDLAYAGDPYSAGQVHALCLTALIGGLDGSEVVALRKLGPSGSKAADILERAAPKELNSSNPNSVGALRRMEYDGASYHGEVDNAAKSKAPTHGQDALDMSVQVKETSFRRVGIDYETGEFVVFDRTQENVYHGHVRSWADLHQDMKSRLIKSGMTDEKGNIIKGK